MKRVGYLLTLLALILVSCEPGYTVPPGPGSGSNSYTTPPTASFSMKTVQPLTVVLNNTSSNASSYKWDFGDGTTSTLKNPQHKYSSMGVYRIKLYAYAEQKDYDTTTTDWNLLNYTTDEVNLSAPISTTTQINPETGVEEEIPVTRDGLLTANSITIPYSYYQTRNYTYDSERKVYLRYMNNTPHLDKTTGEQLYYKNIIIEQVRNYQLDSAGRQDLDTTGSGEGYYITNGYALPIYWTKSGRSAKTIYTYIDGSEVEINDGNTFIQIVPTSSSPTIN